ncbi:MAG TPA: hypothetical protein PKV50_02150 [Prolixibacteraceae bacterium]|nr:addiction module toxin RelE [Bacteroidales bacterium]HQN93259.1 hypothetical protein [Prolixibacteraceae bacterium]HUM88304.1 hypothetical protein [Prolixibacteraceae bacterium]
MSLNVVTIDVAKTFAKQAKRLAKRYPSFSSDLHLLFSELQTNPEMGENLGHNLRKIRMTIQSKGKGKRGGARIIAHHEIILECSTHSILLLTIYDKSEKESLSKQEIASILKANGII